ncbi:MAG: S41 family peptidase, partial [Psychroflexus sp.]|nr:S41 family peptidase [Psychroflexus sp.]
MKFSLKTYLPIIVALAIVLGMYMGQNLNFPDQKEYKSSSKQKFTKFIDYIDESYVDEVNTDSIVELTLKSVLDQLDPHSSYISQQEYSLVHDEMRGGFVGIGVSFYHIGDSLAVIRTIENGPSDKAGLLPGDRIVEADGVDLSSSVVSDSITKLLKGEKNTNVRLKVKRFDQEKLLSFDVKRDQVPLKSVDATYLLNDTTAYVKINRFSETTYSEFKGRMQKMPQEKIKSIVLDLRNNTGGYLQEATQIADEFLKEDQLIVFTKNKDG